MRLKTPYNAHPGFTETMLSIWNFNKTSPNFKEMVCTHQATRAVAMVDMNIQLTMPCCVYYKKNDEGTTTSIFLNRSVVELKLGLTGTGMSGSFPILCAVEGMPDIAMSGTNITRKQIEGSNLTGPVKLGAMSSAIPLPHGKSIIEGYGSDKLDEFEDEYGK